MLETKIFSGLNYKATAVLSGDGIYRTLYTGETLSDIRKQHPDVELVSLEQWVNKSRAALIGPIYEISSDDYKENLNILPPVNFNRFANGFECFKSSELHSFDLTTIYVKYQNHFYCFRDSVYLSAEEILEKIKSNISDKKIIDRTKD